MSPLLNFYCPDAVKIPVKDCLCEGGCRRNDRCATRSYLRLVARERVWTGKPSTTQLIQGTMCAFLKLTQQYSVSPDQRAFMINGTNAHSKLEDSADEYSILEEKFIEGDISGIADVIERENGHITLADYKTSGSYKVAKALGIVIYDEVTDEVYKTGKRKGEFKTRKRMKKDPEAIDRWEWELQLNKYRIEYEKKYKEKIDELRIQCIVRDGGTYIAKNRGVFRNVYYFNIPILLDDQVLEYFRIKKEALEKALSQGKWDEICDAKENWDGVKCARYCEVAEFCNYGRYLKEEREGEEVAIKGLSEVRRMPRVGKIRLGLKLKTATGAEYPKEVDYFILDPETPVETERQALIDEFHKLYGDKPKQIKIYLPVADTEIIFPQYYKRYGSSTMLQCKGNGTEATCIKPEYADGLSVVGKDDFGMTIVKCKGEQCPYYIKKQCSENAVLNVLLPDLPGAGVWQITTGSVHSIRNVNSGIAYLVATAGRAHMIPILLERRETDIQEPDGKKRKHYIMHLNTDYILRDLQKLALVDASRILLELPAPGDDSPDDIIVVPSGEKLNTKTGEILPAEPIAETTAPAEEELPGGEVAAKTKGYKLDDDQMAVFNQFYKERPDWTDNQKTLARNICEEVLKAVRFDINKAPDKLEEITTFPSKKSPGKNVPGVKTIITLSGAAVEAHAKRLNILPF